MMRRSASNRLICCTKSSAANNTPAPTRMSRNGEVFPWRGGDGSIRSQQEFAGLLLAKVYLERARIRKRKVNVEQGISNVEVPETSILDKRYSIFDKRYSIFEIDLGPLVDWTSSVPLMIGLLRLVEQKA